MKVTELQEEEKYSVKKYNQRLGFTPNQPQRNFNYKSYNNFDNLKRSNPPKKVTTAKNYQSQKFFNRDESIFNYDTFNKVTGKVLEKHGPMILRKQAPGELENLNQD